MKKKYYETIDVKGLRKALKRAGKKMRLENETMFEELNKVMKNIWKGKDIGGKRSEQK